MLSRETLIRVKPVRMMRRLPVGAALCAALLAGVFTGPCGGAQARPVRTTSVKELPVPPRPPVHRPRAVQGVPAAEQATSPNPFSPVWQGMYRTRPGQRLWTANTDGIASHRT